MGLLKRHIWGEQGFSIIETLTAIVILGIIVAFSAMLIKGFFFSPKGLLKGDALALASSEMEYTLNQTIDTDTSYLNSTGNILVERKITEKDSVLSIEVFVKSKGSQETLLKLHAFKKR